MSVSSEESAKKNSKRAKKSLLDKDDESEENLAAKIDKILDESDDDDGGEGDDGDSEDEEEEELNENGKKKKGEKKQKNSKAYSNELDVGLAKRNSEYYDEDKSFLVSAKPVLEVDGRLFFEVTCLVAHVSKVPVDPGETQVFVDKDLRQKTGENDGDRPQAHCCWPLLMQKEADKIPSTARTEISRERELVKQRLDKAKQNKNTVFFRQMLVVIEDLPPESRLWPHTFKLRDIFSSALEWRLRVRVKTDMLGSLHFPRFCVPAYAKTSEPHQNWLSSVALTRHEEARFCRTATQGSSWRLCTTNLVGRYNVAAELQFIGIAERLRGSVGLPSVPLAAKMHGLRINQINANFDVEQAVVKLANGAGADVATVSAVDEAFREDAADTFKLDVELDDDLSSLSDGDNEDSDNKSPGSDSQRTENSDASGDEAEKSDESEAAAAAAALEPSPLGLGDAYSTERATGVLFRPSAATMTIWAVAGASGERARARQLRTEMRSVGSTDGAPCAELTRLWLAKHFRHALLGQETVLETKETLAQALLLFNETGLISAKTRQQCEHPTQLNGHCVNRTSWNARHTDVIVKQLRYNALGQQEFAAIVAKSVFPRVVANDKKAARTDLETYIRALPVIRAVDPRIERTRRPIAVEGRGLYMMAAAHVDDISFEQRRILTELALPLMPESFWVIARFFDFGLALCCMKKSVDRFVARMLVSKRPQAALLSNNLVVVERVSAMVKGKVKSSSSRQRSVTNFLIGSLLGGARRDVVLSNVAHLVAAHLKWPDVSSKSPAYFHSHAFVLDLEGPSGEQLRAEARAVFQALGIGMRALVELSGAGVAGRNWIEPIIEPSVLAYEHLEELFKSTSLVVERLESGVAFLESAPTNAVNRALVECLVRSDRFVDCVRTDTIEMLEGAFGKALIQYAQATPPSRLVVVFVDEPQNKRLVSIVEHVLSLSEQASVVYWPCSAKLDESISSPSMLLLPRCEEIPRSSLVHLLGDRRFQNRVFLGGLTRVRQSIRSFFKATTTVAPFVANDLLPSELSLVDDIAHSVETHFSLCDDMAHLFWQADAPIAVWSDFRLEQRIRLRKASREATIFLSCERSSFALRFVNCKNRSDVEEQLAAHAQREARLCFSFADESAHIQPSLQARSLWLLADQFTGHPQLDAVASGQVSSAGLKSSTLCAPLRLDYCSPALATRTERTSMPLTHWLFRDKELPSTPLSLLLTMQDTAVLAVVHDAFATQETCADFNLATAKSQELSEHWLRERARVEAGFNVGVLIDVVSMEPKSLDIVVADKQATTKGLELSSLSIAARLNARAKPNAKFATARERWLLKHSEDGTILARESFAQTPMSSLPFLVERAIRLLEKKNK